jgi:uncharacterized protein (TIGR03435 family)
MRSTIGLGLALLLVASAGAQMFEAAALKPTPVGGPMQYIGFMGGPGSDDPGRIVSSHTSLKMFIMRAYKVKPYQVIGPGWLETELYDLTAKVPPNATADDVGMMLRNLLAERFKLEQHNENKEMSVYSLVVGKDGPKLKEYSPAPPETAVADTSSAKGPVTGSDGFPLLRPAVFANGPVILYRKGQARLHAANLTMLRLADSLSQQLDRLVLDDTGLAGHYDFTLTWTPDNRANLPAPTDALDDANDIFTALQRQLGLRLAARKAAVPCIVVDHMAKAPAEM